MRTYLVRRFTTIPFLLVGVTLFVFLILHLAPGDPTVMMLGQEYSPERAALLRAELGLDKPLLVQYAGWMGRVLQGDLGRALITKEPVVKLILQRLPTSMWLAAGSMLVAAGMAVPLGVVTAVRRGSWIDTGGRLLSVAGVSMPVFWVGILLLVQFSVTWRLLPPGGGIEQHGLKALVLPSITLGISFAALLARMTRSSLLEVLRQDYIRTARAKGVAQRALIYRHAMKNALIPVITVGGLQLGHLLGGAVLTETIFALPGLGRLLYTSINSRDYPTLQGTMLFTALTLIAINLMVDAVYALIDPRIRYT